MLRRFLLDRIAICTGVRVSHLLIAVTAALVILVEFFAHLRLRLGAEVFVHALVVLVCASANRGFAITRGKIVILQCCRKDSTGLGIVSVILEIWVEPYIISHFVLCLDSLGPKEALKRLLLFAATTISYVGFQVSQFDSPVDIGELVLRHPGLHGEGNVKRPTCRHGASHSRHGD